MARLNKTKLDSVHLHKLYDRLNTYIGGMRAQEADAFLQELLGPEERIMVAKRFAAIVMIAEGHSLYRTSETLKISSGTAERIKQRINKGSYDHLLQLLKSRTRNYTAVLQLIDDILHLGGILPHYNSIERYKHIR